MTNAKLLIQQQPSSETLTQEFALIGTIDVDASRVLETLYVLPAKASAELNFAQVEWINSMGLAQLFKLFEHWKKQEINVRITRANQTVCVLLNQTGLSHLLADDQHHLHGIHKIETHPSVTHTNPAPNPPTLDVVPPVLQILPTPTPDMTNQQFSLIGNIDVAAVQLLHPLYCLPANSKVELNFSQVDRVNSMGLAQLLKLFEHWQKQNIAIHISEVNRMITVLFKMTGLTRFLASNSNASVGEPTPHLSPASTSRIITETPAQSLLPPTIDLTTLTGLMIEPSPSATALEQRFNFAGIIDIESIKPLNSLYIVPANCEVELNFAQVQRVNSMGLAQLLKLFEHWQKQHIAIHIINSNRMIGVLFKMTGLTRFLTEPSTRTHSTTAPFFVEPNPNPHLQAPITPLAIASPPSVSPVSSNGKLNLWVNVQSSQQMNGWYFFNTYLQRQMGKEVHLELIHGAMSDREIRIEEMDIVFTKPFEATRLFLEHNFQPLLRPIDQTDEVTLLVRANDPRMSLRDYQGGKIVTAAANNFVYLLGRFLLEENDESLKNMAYLFSGHDIKALQMLLKGSADILFMLSETYHGLSGLTKKNLRQIDQSETAFAFHLFSISPQLSHMSAAVSNVLLDMSLDSQGRQVLADLGIAGWTKPTQDECDMLAMLYKRYVDH